MFKYKAILKSNDEVVAVGNSLKEVQNSIKTFKRGQKRGEHTNSNNAIQIYHVRRSRKDGLYYPKEVFVKTIL